MNGRSEDTRRAIGRIDLGPSVAELFSVFRLPVVGIVGGLILLVIGLTAADTNLATILAIIVAPLSVVLGIMEWRDLAFSTLSWDSAALTLERKGAQPLTITWEQIGQVRVHEVVIARRLGAKHRRLWVEVRPINWTAFAAGRPGLDPYTPAEVSDYTVGIPASRGTKRRDSLDRTLRESALPCYTGVSSEVTKGR